jgi:dihydrofolate synthase/folylpolyglutamate synthase
VAHLAEAILRASGRRTGLYTSPHLVDLRERIRLNGRPVSVRDFVGAMNAMAPLLDRLRPTFFEIMTAAAFQLFARKRVDVAVIEVGLGGRLDATNVLTPAACAITPIDFDHSEKLGRTLGAIAREKAGIIKPGIPVVSGRQRPAAMAELRRHAEPILATSRVFRQTSSMVHFTTGRVCRCTLRTLGRHQADNAATAVALVKAAGVEVSPSAVRKAFRGARLPARSEVVARRPWIIVDGAHNPFSARALAASLRRVPRRRTILVFGASADKDWRAMLRCLMPDEGLAIFTRAAVPRAADPGMLARHARGAAVTVRSVAQAVALARRLARPEDAVVITGSFYVAGEALKALAGDRRDRD